MPKANKNPNFKMKIGDVNIPMHPNPNHPDNKSPVGVMGRFVNMFKGFFKKKLQVEFDKNTKRVNTPENDVDLNKSKSFLPTVGRALKNSLPIFIGGFFSMIGELLGSLLGIFKVKAETKEAVKSTVKLLGKGLFSDPSNPGEGIKTAVESAAPSLIKAFMSMLGVKTSAETVKQAARFPATFTPAKKTAARVPAIPLKAAVTQVHLDDVCSIFKNNF